MRYFACQVQTIINLCSLYLISNSWRPRWRPCLVTSQTSSSATTHKIYLILSRRTKVFHRRQNCFEILPHIKNSRERFHQPHPPPPSTPCTCTTMGVWLCVYFQGLIVLGLNIFLHPQSPRRKASNWEGGFSIAVSVCRDSNFYPDYSKTAFAGFTPHLTTDL